MELSSKPLMVSIQCFVYNQESYIRQCLDGIVSQITNFRFEAIVHDDASTDNTSSIIKEYEMKYPSIIKAIYEKENQYSKHDGSLVKIVDNYTKGKYVATCEGDDYWIDPHKLQMQVDFMEEHPDYSLCFTNFSRSDGIKYKQQSYPDSEYEKMLIQGANVIGTLTTLYRKSIYDNLPKEYRKNKWNLGDLPLWIELSHYGYVKYLDKITAIYRVLPNSASHSSDIMREIAFIDDLYEIRKFYNQKFGNKYKVLSPFLAKMKSAYKHYDKNMAYIIAKQSIKEGCFDEKVAVFYLGTIIPFLRKLINLYYRL